MPDALARAQRAHDRRAYRQAADAYREHLEECGDDDVLIALGDVLGDLNEEAAARVCYATRLRSNPEDEVAAVRLASSANAVGDLGLARQTLRDVYAGSYTSASLGLEGPLRDALDASLVADLVRTGLAAAASPLGAGRGRGDVGLVTILSFRVGSASRNDVRGVAGRGEEAAPRRHLLVSTCSAEGGVAPNGAAFDGAAQHGGVGTTVVRDAGTPAVAFTAPFGTSERALVNYGLAVAAAAGADVVVVRDPASVAFTGLTTLVSAFGDPMVGFSVLGGLDAYACRPLHPPGSGDAVWIRGRILAEFGGLDAVYDDVDAALIDLAARANRAGFLTSWKAAPSAPRPLPGGLDGEIVARRYPEVARSRLRVAKEPQNRAKRLEESLRNVPQTLLLDITTLSQHFDGIAEATVSLVSALDAAATFEVHLWCDPAAARFHGLGRFAASGRLIAKDAVPDVHTACVRLSQPTSHADLVRTWSAAPVAGFLIHDAIALDIEQLNAADIEPVWSLALAHSDLIGFVSDYSAAQVARRFGEAHVPRRFVARNSTAAAEYGGGRPSASKWEGVLVVGNAFPHKNLDATVSALRSAHPDLPLTVLGVGRPSTPHVRWHRSGSLTKAKVRALYRDTLAVVYPSFYEGFGFPLMHALSHGRPVLAIDQPVFGEIKRLSGSGANVYLFPTTAALVAGLSDVLARPFSPPDPSIREHRWNDAAEAMFAAVRRGLHAFDHDALVRRLELVRVLEAGLG